MQIESLAIPDVKILTPRKIEDYRGFFSETYSKPAFAAAGLRLDFVQDNQSLSKQAGVLRGLHFQSGEFAQDKLLRVVRGRIFDVAVDIRHGSPTFGQWVGAEISAEAWNQILVPKGFAHGFVTLEPDTEVLYKVTAEYAPDFDHGIAWNDPDIAVKWPLHGDAPILSDRDTRHPRLADSPVYFTF